MLRAFSRAWAMQERIEFGSPRPGSRNVSSDPSTSAPYRLAVGSHVAGAEQQRVPAQRRRARRLRLQARVIFDVKATGGRLGSFQ